MALSAIHARNRFSHSFAKSNSLPRSRKPIGIFSGFTSNVRGLDNTIHMRKTSSQEAIGQECIYWAESLRSKPLELTAEFCQLQQSADEGIVREVGLNVFLGFLAHHFAFVFVVP